MKKNLLCLLFIFVAMPLIHAVDFAVLEIKTGKEKKTQRVVIEFYEKDAPVTVANFKKLIQIGYYKGIAFHRVVPELLVQAGDPLSRGKDRSKVGTSGPGYTIPPEISRSHTVGAVAMARLPDSINPARLSNGSQFYICLKPMPNLDGQYTVFAHVTEGIETLKTMSALSVDSNDNPIERVVIQSTKLFTK